jgi:membrane fusion protein (multidrug efflux system)
VTTELAGQVVGIHFDSGQAARKGQLLVQLNDAVEQAELRRLEAQLILDRISLERSLRLVKSHAIPQSQVDMDQSHFDQTNAQIANQKALIAKKAIRAPFDGMLGIRQVDLGQYLAPGTAVVPLQALNPIYVDFALPQQTLPLVAVDQKVQVTTDAFPGQDFEGKIEAINPEVDVETRNYMIRALLSNEKHILHPGLFAEVTVRLPETRQIVTVPQTAVTYNPYGEFVYVVEEEQSAGGANQRVARQRFVKVGERRGDQVAIMHGIKPGEQVVVAGQVKLKEGSVVQINNSVLPSNNPQPSLPNT